LRKVLIALKKKKEENVEKIAGELLSDIAEVLFLEDIEDGVEDVEVLVLFQWRGVIGEGLIGRLRSLKFIQALTAGVNHLPFEEIPENVLVASNSGANAGYIAEHAFALMLAAAKRLFLHDRLLRKGEFRQDIFSKPLRGSVLGILGLGSIGRRILELGCSFGMKVYAVRKSGKPEAGAEFVGTPDDLPYVLREADYLVIALPLTRHTEGLIGERELSLMKRDAVLVNVSRGKIIDQEALYRHLLSNREFTACLDVWWNYPRAEESFRQDFPFEKLPNVIMTPHIAPLVPGYFENMLRHALENVRTFLLWDSPANIVDRKDYVP